MAQRKLEKTPEENRKTVDLVCLPSCRPSAQPRYDCWNLSSGLVEKSDNTHQGRS
jgi:hypothetical protein